MGERFRLVFAGDVLDGHRVDDVQQKMAELLRLPAARRSSMFSGKRTVLKRGMSLPDATRYAAKFERIGARVRIEPDDERAPRSRDSGVVPLATAPAPLAAAPAASRTAARATSPRPPSRRTTWVAAAGALAVAAFTVAGLLLHDGASPLAPRATDTRLASYGLSDEARAAFRASYWPAGGNKAFAASTGGAFGLAAGAASDQEAAQRALADCEGRRPQGAPACRLVDLTGSWAPVTP